MPALIGAALFVGAALLYGMGTLSASMPRWLVLYVWASVACVVWGRGWRVDRIDGLALSLLLWMALSLAWSSDWRQGVFEVTNATALCAVFMWVRRYPDWIPEAAAVALIGTLVLQYLYPEDWAGHGNRNFVTETVLLLLALSADIRRLPWLVLFCGAGILLWLNPSKIEVAVIAFMVLFYGRKLYLLHSRPA